MSEKVTEVGIKWKIFKFKKTYINSPGCFRTLPKAVLFVYFCAA